MKIHENTWVQKWATRPIYLQTEMRIFLDSLLCHCLACSSIQTEGRISVSAASESKEKHDCTCLVSKRNSYYSIGPFQLPLIYQWLFFLELNSSTCPRSVRLHCCRALSYLYLSHAAVHDKQSWEERGISNRRHSEALLLKYIYFIWARG